MSEKQPPSWQPTGIIQKAFDIAAEQHKGGVTSEFLKNTIQLWAGMLLHSLGFFEGPAVEVEEE